MIDDRTFRSLGETRFSIHAYAIVPSRQSHRLDIVTLRISVKKKILSNSLNVSRKFRSSRLESNEKKRLLFSDRISFPQ